MLLEVKRRSSLAILYLRKIQNKLSCSVDEIETYAVSFTFAFKMTTGCLKC